MGQVALGFRSLIVKVAIFVLLAALLAWAMGGTLWPRPETADLEGVDFAGRTWYWKLLVGGSDEEAGRVRWQLMVAEDGARGAPVDERFHRDAADPPVVAHNALYVGVRPLGQTAWAIERIDADGRVSSHPMPDRLAVERQLARLAAGLPLQGRDTILAERHLVLDPDPPAAGAGDDSSTEP